MILSDKLRAKFKQNLPEEKRRNPEKMSPARFHQKIADTIRRSTEPVKVVFSEPQLELILLVANGRLFAMRATFENAKPLMLVFNVTDNRQQKQLSIDALNAALTVFAKTTMQKAPVISETKPIDLVGGILPRELQFLDDPDLTLAEKEHDRHAGTSDPVTALETFTAPQPAAKKGQNTARNFLQTLNFQVEQEQWFSDTDEPRTFAGLKKLQRDLSKTLGGDIVVVVPPAQDSHKGQVFAMAGRHRVAFQFDKRFLARVIRACQAHWPRADR